jgi:hypothetical protein
MYVCTAYQGPIGKSSTGWVGDSRSLRGRRREGGSATGLLLDFRPSAQVDPITRASRSRQSGYHFGVFSDQLPQVEVEGLL